MIHAVQKLKRKINIKEAGTNLFIFEIQETLDLIRIEKRCSWSFDRNLFCLCKFDGKLAPNQVSFTQEPMWVQLHNILLGMMNTIYGEDLGKNIGEVIELDVDKDGIGWSPYVLIRVQVNMSKPLAWVKLINFMGKQSWISFKYERVSNFCFNCGIIKYPSSVCSKGVINGKLHLEEPPQYGTQLRASLSKSTHKVSPITLEKN